MEKPKLLDEVRRAARLKHLSLRTEKAYAYYIRQFTLFHDKRHPAIWVPLRCAIISHTWQSPSR
ncbi:MAG: phage integrase N-terminal SAM-like domain-containing protein [Acidobacteriota bacterium]|nr:phage integrase N-terminal SAM-like domain-containing protein [Acidobacteriota bacterium]